MVLPGSSKATPLVLALPTPDGTVPPLGQQDPLAASPSLPLPSYVQIADIERKKRLLAQEQQLWQQYASNGMQDQVGFARIVGTACYYDATMQPVLPHGMPQLTGWGQPGGYYYTSY